jgi:hypothetical protein
VKQSRQAKQLMKSEVIFPVLPFDTNQVSSDQYKLIKKHPLKINNHSL